LVLLTVGGLAGCSVWSDSPQDRFDATGLTYVAAERAKDRPAGNTDETAPQLAGFVGKLNIVDGQARLSLEEVVRRTLKSSLAIQVASYTPAMAEADILAAESIFDATFFLEGSMLNVDHMNMAFVNLAGNQYTREITRAANTGFRKTFATGGSLTLSEEFQYFFTNSPLMAPRTYGSDLKLELAQPLLKNLGLDVTKAQIYIASHQRDATIDDFRRTVMDALVSVERLYWELVFATRDVEVRRRSVELADEVYRKEKGRAEQQMARPLEVSRAKAAYTSRQAELIRAQNLVHNLSDQIKNAMNDPEIKLTEGVLIAPTDEPPILAPVIDRNASVVQALDLRPELQNLRNQIKALEVQHRYDQNQLLPRLDATFSWIRNSVDVTSRHAWYDQGTGRFTDYGAGLLFEVPLGNRLAEANYRRSRLAIDQAQRSLDQAMQQVILEVNTSIREVETNLEEITATREARIAAKDTLDGEQARYDAGDVTNEELLRAQRDLEEAQRNEIQAITRLNVSVMQLERAKGSLLDYDNIHVVHPNDLGQRTEE
jgi:outer membrane protein TolC